MTSAHEHWNRVYAELAPTGGSWTRSSIQESLDAIALVAPRTNASVLDVGGGLDSVSFELARLGHEAYVLDISAVALGLPRDSSTVWVPGIWPTLQLCAGDVLTAPLPVVDVWHDRATSHFFVDEAQRATYVERVANHVVPGGGIVIAGFSTNGPTHCSGLPVARRSPEELAREFSEHFSVLDAFERDHVTPAGVTQRFAWLLGRRVE